MSKPLVFMSRRLPPVALERLSQRCQVEVWPEQLPPSRAILEAQAAKCDGMITLLTDRIDAALLDRAPRLRVVSNYAVGFNNIDVPACTQRGICVGNTPGVLTDATADLAFCLLIAAARRLVESDAYSRQGHWKTWEPLGHIGQDLVGRTLGIVGMGRIGYALAQRCHGGWGMKVLYHDKFPNEAAEKNLGAKRVELETLLAESDFVSVHVDLNDATKGLFNLDRFRQMKRTAVFINTARGPIHVQADLCRALKEGLIFAAGLDVTDPEPPESTDPLLSLPNVIVAPHIASATEGTRRAMAEIAADNCLAGLLGEPLRCWVNPEVAGSRRRAL